MKGLVIGLSVCLLVAGSVTGQQDVGQKTTEVVWEATILGISG